jgi:hypothetical protein
MRPVVVRGDSPAANGGLTPQPDTLDRDTDAMPAPAHMDGLVLPAPREETAFAGQLAAASRSAQLFRLFHGAAAATADNTRTRLASHQHEASAAAPAAAANDAVYLVCLHLRLPTRWNADSAVSIPMRLAPERPAQALLEHPNISGLVSAASSSLFSISVVCQDTGRRIDMTSTIGSQLQPSSVGHFDAPTIHELCVVIGCPAESEARCSIELAEEESRRITVSSHGAWSLLVAMLLPPQPAALTADHFISGVNLLAMTEPLDGDGLMATQPNDVGEQALRLVNDALRASGDAAASEALPLPWWTCATVCVPWKKRPTSSSPDVTVAFAVVHVELFPDCVERIASHRRHVRSTVPTLSREEHLVHVRSRDVVASLCGSATSAIARQSHHRQDLAWLFASSTRDDLRRRMHLAASAVREALSNLWVSSKWQPPQGFGNAIGRLSFADA